MIIELSKTGLEIESEVERAVLYYGVSVGKRRVDLLVNKQILIELKAIAQIDNDCYNQVLNCLNVFELEVGLLINFGKSRLEFKRFVNSGMKKYSADDR